VVLIECSSKNSSNELVERVETKWGRAWVKGGTLQFSPISFVSRLFRTDSRPFFSTSYHLFVGSKIDNSNIFMNVFYAVYTYFVTVTSFLITLSVPVKE